MNFQPKSVANSRKWFSKRARISHRVARTLEAQGLLQRDAENSYLALNETDDKPMNRLHGHSITYRIAAGQNEGRKVFTLQTLPPTDEPSTGIATVAGFSLHVSYPRDFLCVSAASNHINQYFLK